MKTFCLLAAAILLVALCSPALSQHSSGPSECCFDFYTKRIPVSRIQSFKVSHADCPKKGIILKTVKDVELCVNPADQSIQDLMEK
ncbi:eotaxin-like [Denticeps clupeoides]|nr:eotaxin-like [Denticeps clupeoides]